MHSNNGTRPYFIIFKVWDKQHYDRKIKVICTKRPEEFVIYTNKNPNFGEIENFRIMIEVRSSPSFFREIELFYYFFIFTDIELSGFGMMKFGFRFISMPLLWACVIVEN